MIAAAAQARPRSRERLRLAGLSLAIALATIAVYHPVVGFDFVSYDDWKLVRDNEALQAGLTRENVRRAFAEPYYLNWIPLTTISYLIDRTLQGPGPGGYHATNLALHVAASVLLLLALHQLTGALWPSAFVAGVFALHPLHVEPVAWIASRKDVLSGVFFAATLLAYAHYARRPGVLRLALVLAAATAGLLSKPMLVTLPFVLLLLDLWPLGRLAGGRRAWLRCVGEKLPLLAPVLVVTAVTMRIQPVVWQGGHAFDTRLANALDATLAYLRTSVWPTGLAVFYPHPGVGISAGAVLLASCVLALITIAVLSGVGRRPYLTVGWLWFLGTLVPVIGLVEVGLQARADRYMYLPLAGLALMLAFGAAGLASRGPRWRAALAAAALASLVLQGIAARVQLGYWRDSVHLFERAIAVTERNYLAHFALAGALAERGDLVAARAELMASIRDNPRWPRAYRQLAELDLLEERYGEALSIYRGLLQARPDDAELHLAAGDAALRLGQAADARDHYRRALRLRPGWTVAARALAWLLATHPDPDLRDPDEARRLAQAALAHAEGQDAALLDALAAAHAAAGEFERAADLSAQARRLAEEQGLGDLADEITRRRALYRARTPYVEDLPLDPPPRSPENTGT